MPRAHWLTGLAHVLDDEPIVVIDHATGRGFRLTMSGIGDNFQLHTLLADRLIGDAVRGLLAGEPPAPAWVAAATTAPEDQGLVNRIRAGRRSWPTSASTLAGVSPLGKLTRLSRGPCAP